MRDLLSHLQRFQLVSSTVDCTSTNRSTGLYCHIVCLLETSVNLKCGTRQKRYSGLSVTKRENWCICGPSNGQQHLESFWGKTCSIVHWGQNAATVFRIAQFTRKREWRKCFYAVPKYTGLIPWY